MNLILILTLKHNPNPNSNLKAQPLTLILEHLKVLPKVCYHFMLVRFWSSKYHENKFRIGGFLWIAPSGFPGAGRSS